MSESRALTLQPGQRFVALNELSTYTISRIDGEGLTVTFACSAVGWDLGNSASKLSLAYIKSNNEVFLVHVPFCGSRDDPEQSYTPHDFTACVALRDGKTVVGKQSLDLDLNIPLKTMLVFLASITRKKTIEALPSEKLLLEAVKEGNITTGAMETAITQHFGLLRTSVPKQAKNLNVKIKVIVVTYPNYLASQVQSGDHERYLKKYLSPLRPLWDHDIRFKTVSEGQVAANYICEWFEDLYSSSGRRERHETLFKGLNPDLGLNLLVVDVGASTLVCIYFPSF